jgi:hypothetical protein
LPCLVAARRGFAFLDQEDATCSASRSKPEQIAHLVPKLSRQLGNVRGTFWQLETLPKSEDVAETPCFKGEMMVGTTGIEPVTPTMSR